MFPLCCCCCVEDEVTLVFTKYRRAIWFQFSESDYSCVNVLYSDMRNVIYSSPPVYYFDEDEVYEWEMDDTLNVVRNLKKITNDWNTITPSAEILRSYI